MRILFFIFSSIFFSINCFSTNFRFTDKKEAHSKVFIDYKIKVAADGSYVAKRKNIYTLLHEKEKNRFATQKITYSPKLESVDNIYACSKNTHSISLVQEEDIEDKPIASQASGFDNIYQILINYKNVEIGSKVHLEYTHKRHSSFSRQFNIDLSSIFYSNNILEKGSCLYISSKLPLYFNLHDPKSYIINKIKISKPKYKDGYYEMKLEVIDDIFVSPIPQEHANYIGQYIPQLVVSSCKNYEDFVNKDYILKIKDLMNQSTNEFMQAALKKAKKQKSLQQTANSLMTDIITKYRYMGDWRTIAGSYIPRDFKQIQDTGYGDCKDFSLMLAHMLRSLGYQASVALINRSSYPPLKKLLPTEDINHAIVHVKLLNKSYWFDPTNNFAYAASSWPDISDRLAIVVDDKKLNTYSEYIPYGDYKSSIVKVDLELNYNQDGSVSAKEKYTYSGLQALFRYGNFFAQSPRQQKYIARSYVASAGKRKILSSSKVELSSKFKTRTAEDFSISTQMKYADMSAKTSVGKAFVLDPYFKTLTSIVANNYENQIFLISLPHTIVKDIRIRNARLVANRKQLRYSLSSPWISATRHIAQQGKDIVIKERVALKKAHITTSQIRSPEFARLQADLSKHLDTMILIFEPYGTNTI
jgi:hypothetical protein